MILPNQESGEVDDNIIRQGTAHLWYGRGSINNDFDTTNQTIHDLMLYKIVEEKNDSYYSVKGCQFWI